MKHGEIYKRGENLFAIIKVPNWGNYKNWVKTGLDYDFREKFTEQELIEHLKDHTLVFSPQEKNNCNINGTEARVLISLLNAKDFEYRGSMLRMLAALDQKLEALHLNQPPVQEQKNDNN